MAAEGTFMDGLSEWHTIRPGKPPLSLSVREITSVSATFILSSTFSDFGAEPYLASLGLAADDDNDDDDADDETDDSVSAEPKKTSVISEALATGLSVNVNSAIWKGVYIRIDDKTDEAVIIIYGLMPGKKYDIDLGLVQDGQSNNIRRQVVTDDLDIPSQTTLPDGEEDSFEAAESPAPTQSSSPSGTIASTPPNPTPHPQFTLEDRLNQLQHTLSLIVAERDTLTGSLKAARRDAQKADAALRSEIEILKRASEKHTVSEARARQKVLALQEAAKRAQTATREMEETVVEVEAELPALLRQRAEKEEAHSKIKEDADRVRKEKEREAEKERRKLDHMRGELTGLSNKMDRLNVKRERLETGTLPDLEEQLREIELEIARVEADPLGYAYSHSDDSFDGLDDEQPVAGGYAGATSGQWGRPPAPSTILTRPSPIPIQRPGAQNTSSGSSSNNPSFHQWSAAPSRYPGLPGATPLPQQQQQHQRSASARTVPRSPSAIPQRHPSLKSPNTSTTSDSSSSSPTSVPAVAVAASTSGSTLSGRAPPFEPGRMSLPLRTGPGVYAVGGAAGQWARGKWMPS